MAAQLGVLAVTMAYDRWGDTISVDEFSEVARRTLRELRVATAVC